MVWYFNAKKCETFILKSKIQSSRFGAKLLQHFLQPTSDISVDIEVRSTI